MKTDKELLELAAKAAGYKNIKHDALGFYRVIGEHEDGTLCMTQFNPLTDDSDALRLAVKLEVDVTHYQNSVEVKAWIAGEYYDFISEEVSYCRISATRRAIVRAAAAIGEKL